MSYFTAEPLDLLPHASLGEGPWWDAQAQRLLYVDIDQGDIRSLTPATDSFNTVAHIDGPVSFALSDTEGGVVAGLRDGVYRIDFAKAKHELIARAASQPPRSRMNDGICDRRGRLWVGTMSLDSDRPATSSLYRLNAGTLQEVLSGVRVSNGLGWSPDNKTMYYNDTRTLQTKAFDFDIDTGALSNPRPFAAFKGGAEGSPDGLTVDSQGRVLVALFRAGRIDIYRPDGALDSIVNVPHSPNVSSMTFGDADLKTLYITTAFRDDFPETSGRLYTVRLPVPGLPEARFDKTATFAAPRL